jgi:hypothetical protein
MQRVDVSETSRLAATVGEALNPDHRHCSITGVRGCGETTIFAGGDIERSRSSFNAGSDLRRCARNQDGAPAVTWTRAVEDGRSVRKGVVEAVGHSPGPGEHAIDLTDDGDFHWGPGEGPSTHPTAADIEDELGLPALDRELAVPPGRAEWMPPPGWKPRSK